MIYRVIGIMSGSSLDGLDLAFVEFDEQSGHWQYNILEASCMPYSREWAEKLREAHHLGAREYLLLDAAYGHYIGEQVNAFIEKYALEFKVSLIASHGHTVFHLPPDMTAQMGSGAAIAARTSLPVVSDLRAVDVALGGQGAPIVPMGEKLLFKGIDLFLNLGGIANLSVNSGGYIAYDVCAANRVLNMLAERQGLEFDRGGELAASGRVNEELLGRLDSLSYYKRPYPKSLANDFGTDIVFPLLIGSGDSDADLLATYTRHIASRVAAAVQNHLPQLNVGKKMMVTGGGAFNNHLMQLLAEALLPMQVDLIKPEDNLVKYKEALIMALLGVLRWREDVTTLSTVTGASRDSIGGALWIPA